MISTAQSIKKLREARGLGVRELAREIGISAAFLSKVESGQKKPGRLILLAIVDYLSTGAEASDKNYAAKFETLVAEAIQNLMTDKGVNVQREADAPDFSVTLPSGREFHISVKSSGPESPKSSQGR